MHFGFPCGEGCWDAWQGVTGGYDGKLYVYNSAYIDMNPAMSKLRDLNRYDPVTKSWSYVLLPAIFDDREYMQVSPLPIHVDKQGNIYIQYSFFENEDRKNNLLKMGAGGQVIWHFTEADLPDEQILFLDNDLFVGLETGRLLQVMAIPASTSLR